ncbi:hypothetical protein IFM89_006851 [Coptis chinensis]|uniref:Uncharacterized protein n=1 Tax=Coptis chinensis TaxID=261450 RepID=A0A835LYV6_9MAGN|nr:hypothetical protein IFM89_006851 [Coptis chinensis]
MMVNEGNTSHAISKNEERRTRRSTSRMIEEEEEMQEKEVSLKDLLRRMNELEKQNQMLMAENKLIREEKEKHAEDAMYEKDDEESSSGAPIVRKSHLEERKKSHIKEKCKYRSIKSNFEHKGECRNMEYVGLIDRHQNMDEVKASTFSIVAAGSLVPPSQGHPDSVTTTGIPEKLSATMEIMDMTTETMSDAIDDAVNDDEAEEETDDLTNEVLDEIGVEVATQLSATPKGRIAGKKTEDLMQ